MKIAVIGASGNAVINGVKDIGAASGALEKVPFAGELLLGGGGISDYLMGDYLMGDYAPGGSFPALPPPQGAEVASALPSMSDVLM